MNFFWTLQTQIYFLLFTFFNNNNCYLCTNDIAHLTSIKCINMTTCTSLYAITPSSCQWTLLQFFWQSTNHKQRMEKQNSQSPKYISYSIKNTKILPFIAIALSHCGVNTGIWLVTKSLNITIYLVTRFYEFDQKWALFFVSVNVWVTSSPCLHSFNFWLIDILGIIW